MSYILRLWRSFVKFFKTTPKRYTITGLVILVVAVLLGMHALTRSVVAPAAIDQTPQVTLESVSSLSSDQSALPVTGTVQSESQATILAQSAGEITSVNHKLGDTVYAGEVIGKLENSSQAASVVQAQGAYEAAQAQLLKTQNGGTNNQKDISQIQNNQAQQTVTSSYNTAVSALKGAFSSADDALRTKTDIVFSNPTTNPKFVLSTPNSQLTINVQNERQIAEQKLADLGAGVNALTTSSDVDASIDHALADIQYLSSLLSDVSLNVSQAIASSNLPQATIDADLASVNGGRSELNGAVTALNAAKSGYDSAVSAASVAQKQQADTSIGGRPEDVGAAQANVKQALGALYAAQANLEKTIIRSPISGTIVTLPIKRGDFVTAFAQAAIVSNAHALKVVAYVTASDAKTLAVGSKAIINGNVSGTVTSIAPALDPTNNKIEVNVGITGDASSLTDNQTVSITLDRAVVPKTNTQTTKAPAGPISIPIVAVKITPDGPAVFTVNASSTLVAHPVTLGTILGDRVVVLSGVTPDLAIVSDARGKTDGEVVVVAQ